jgi:hypothetical protein
MVKLDWKKKNHRSQDVLKQHLKLYISQIELQIWKINNDQGLKVPSFWKFNDEKML